ncbi:MAG: TIGR04211 family SH3 domain-containing protein [Gammaproteobacteria bacterium]
MHLLTMASFVLLVMSISPAASAQTAYVSDQLKIPLRSGASSGHRIIKFLRSGTRLTVVDTEGDYTEVEVSGGKSGWVLSADIMDIPSGRDRIVVVNKKLAESRSQVKELKSTVAELKSEIRQLKNEKGTLQNERTNLSNSLEDLKITAANPVALSKKNKQLKKELGKANANVEMLDKDNQQLRSNVMQEWFVIGGAVAIGSLILGIILTRINWRRKRDSWGDSF